MEIAYGFGYAIGLLFVLAVVLIPAIFFLITQQNTLKAIQPQNRMMSPGEVWLQLIPLFNIVFCFLVVNRIAESLQKELANPQPFSFELDLDHYSYGGSEKPTQQIGMAMCILNCVSIVPVIGMLAGIAAFICWIIYWTKLSKYKNQLQGRDYRYRHASAQNSNDGFL